jgi:hypothetical protein
MQIIDFKSRAVSTPAGGDTSVTIADLAMFLTFDEGDASVYQTSLPVIAYEALEDEYGAFEKVGGASDFYDGCWMKFTDGSTIRIEGKP